MPGGVGALHDYINTLLQQSKACEAKAKGWWEVKRTYLAIRQCAEWLSYCLSIGWKKDELDRLEALWWKHHDGNGLLKPKRKGRK